MNSNDYLLSVKYKNMCGLNNIITSNNSNSTIFLGSTTVNSNLNISNTSIFQNIVLINSNLTTFKNTILNKTNLNNNFFISGTSLINNLSCSSNLFGANNMFINSNLNIQNAVLNNLTLFSTLNVSDVCTLSNGIFVNNISSLSLTIDGNIITIGNSNSIVDIIGTSVYISNSEFELKNRIITVNSSSNFSALDIGNLCGIEIYGNNSTGYLRTNNLANRFEIKTPLDITSNYIALVDNNYNLIISGATILQDNVSILSNLNISSNSIFNNLLIRSNFTISGNTLLNNVYLNSINVSSNSLFNRDLNIYNLNISGFSIINNNSTFGSSLNLNTSIFGNCSILSSINASSNVILNNNVSINSNLNLNNNIIQGSVTVGSQLNIINNTLINQSTFLSNLNILGNTNIKNASVSSSLYVNGSTNISGNITFGSNLNTNLNIILPLAEYIDNNNAASAGVPLWGFYRTGDIVKIRVNNIPPTITLIGGNFINIIINTLYTDPGLIITDSLGEIITGSIISINDGKNEYITTPIPVIGTNTIIPNSILNTSIVNTYIFTYSATNSFNNITITTRTVYIGYPLAFNVSYGSFAPVTRNFTVMNNTDWTCEIWLYMTSYYSDYLSIFDFEDYPARSNTAGARQGTFSLCILPITNTLGFFGYSNGNSYTTFSFSDVAVPLNKWCHVVWMRKNNNLYGIINGKSSTAKSTNTTPYNCFNNLINVQNLLICMDTWRLSVCSSNWNDISVIQSRKFQGYIKYPLVRLGTFYDPAVIFCPPLELTPNINSSLLYFVDMNMKELVSGQVLNKVQTVNLYTMLVNPLAPIITLNGSNNMTLLIYSSFVDPGVIATDINGNIITNINISGFVDINNIGNYTLIYTATDQYGLSISVSRNINVTTVLFEIINAPTFTNSMTMNLTQTNFTTLTFEAWIYGNLSGNSRREIFGGTGMGFYLLNEGCSSLTDGYVAGTGTTVSGYCLHMGFSNTFGNTGFRNNTWTHVAVTQNSSGLVTMYYNGIPSTTNTNSIWSGTESISNSLGGGLIGGKMMNVRIWNVARTRDQINNYKNITILNQIDTTTGLIVWYPLQTDTKDLITNTYLGGGNMVFTPNIFDWEIIPNLFNLSSNSIIPIIILKGNNPLNVALNQTFADPGVTGTDLFGNSITVYDVSGSVNTSVLGSYTLTYTVTDIHGIISNSITRTVNVIQYLSYTNYDVYNGNLQINSGLSFNAMNNTNWTCEIWIYMKAINGANAIFDFRQPNNGAYAPNHFWCEINGYKPYIQAMSNRSTIGTSITTNIQLNNWTHVVWMRNNNMLYTFINGFASPGETIPSYLNTLSGLNYMVHGVYSDWVMTNSTSGHFNGLVCQPLITLGAKYNTSGFIPVWDLTPVNYSNVLYWLSNNIETISNQQIIFNRTILQTEINNPVLPRLNLNGFNPFYILLNTTFIDPSCTALDFYNNSLTVINSGSVNTSIIGTYILTYSSTDSSGNTISTTRTVNVVNNLPQISYNLNSGYLGPLQSSVTGIDYTKLWLSDTTFEAWINVTQYPLSSNGNGGMIIDFRNPNYTSVGVINNNSSCIGISTTGNLYVWCFGGTNQNIITNNIIPLNKWTHIVVMRSNNNFYTFINGIISSPLSASGFSNLSNNTALSLGLCNDYKFYSGNPYTYWKYYGYINQASIQLGAKYSLANFTPSSNLAPNSFTSNNYFFLGTNGNDLISGKYMTNINVTTSLISPSITLNSSNPMYILLYSTYTEPNAIATDSLATTISYNTSGSVNANQTGQYNITYTATNDSGTNVINRLVNVVTLPITDIFFWIDASNISKITISSGNISAINDLSSNNVQMIPYYSNTQILNNGINNLPVIYINNSGFYSSNTYANSYNYSFAIVMTIFQTNDWGLIFGHYPINNWNQGLEFRMISGTNNVQLGNDSNTNAGILQTLNAVPVLYIGTRTPTNITLTMTNLQTGAITSISPQGPSSMILGNFNFFMGKFTNSGSYNGKYYIGEIMYWERILTNIEQNKITNYLVLKWSSLTSLNNQILSLSIAPILTLIGPSIYNIKLNNNYNEYGVVVTDLYGNTISNYSISGSVNTSIIGQYIITYSATDTRSVSNSITRTVNVVNNLSVISYDVTNGWLGTLNNNYNSLNGSNWTIECWIYMTSNNTDGCTIIDFRPNNPYVENLTMNMGITSNGYIFFSYNTGSFISAIGTNIVALNKWIHLVYMRNNNNIYSFINGVSNLLSLSPIIPNNLVLNYLTFCSDAGALKIWGSTTSRYKFLGQICQPLITLGAKYSITGFTPQWDLTPTSYSQSNVLFWLNNGVDMISGQTITIQNTVLQNNIMTLPIITLINNDILYLPLNTNYIEYGAIAIDYFNTTNLSITISGTVNTSITGTYTITYSATDSNNNTGSITRTIIVYNNSLSTTAYNFTYGIMGKYIKDLTNVLNNTDFTVEMWIYRNSYSYIPCIEFRDPSSMSGSNGFIYGPVSQTDGGTNKIIFGAWSSSNIQIWNNNTGWINITNSTFALNQWSHIVWMRYNNNFYGFINGFNDKVTLVNTNLNNLTNLKSMIFGQWGDVAYPSTQNSFNGYMSQILIRSGAQYSNYITSGFVPKTDLSIYANSSNTQFFLGNNYTETLTNTQIPIEYTVTTNNRYLSYIQSFDCTLGYIGPINAPSNTNWNTIFSNDFTFELWLYPTQYNSQVMSTILDTRTVGGAGDWTNILILSMSQNGMIGFTWWYNAGGNSRNTYSISTDKILLNQWSHVVWMRKNNYLYVYINGQTYPGFNLTSNNIVFNNLQVVCFCHAVDRSTSDYAYSFQGQISQPLFTNYAKYNTTVSFVPKIDLTPVYNDPTVIFFMDNNLVTTSTVVNQSLPTVQTLTRYGSIYNRMRSALGSWITAYTGSNTLLYNNSMNLSAFTNATSWTFEGWIYLTSISNANLPVIGTTGNPLNFISTGQIGFGYNNSQLWVWNGTINSTYYSTNGLLNNQWNHYAYVMNNSIITFYINGINCGTTPAFTLSNNIAFQINGPADGMTNTNRYIYGYYSQIALMTGAKYLNDFIPYPNLQPSSFTNYLTFLGPNATDLVSGNKFTVYNNFAYTTQQMIIPN